MPLPYYPEPYSFRPPLHKFSTPPPPLSSAGSSSTSTRSSAHATSTNTLPYSDYNNVHIASGDEDSNQALGINPESLVQMLASDPATSSSARRPFRSPDPSRWSESYSNGIRSRSSSLGNGIISNDAHEVPPLPPPLNPKPSYDISWQAVVEKDDIGMSEEETDDEHGVGDSVNDTDLEKDEERTSAAVVAEEGRGLIVQGDNVPIIQLQIQPGTTHLLIGSSSTPNSIPAFLTSTLPQISYSLLALDISANFLGALPPVLADCENLEELNVASNPLRVLPVFLADLINLRVLIADSTGISTLPETLVDLDKLHTVSVRRNKLHALPSWLCLLPALQTLCIDGNPFQGPWKALVEPLLAKVATSPVYPPSTPMLPLSASALSIVDTENDTDTDDLSDHDVASPILNSHVTSPEEEDNTITPARAPFLARSTTSPLPLAASSSPVTQSKPLVRTRTTPNRTYFDQARGKSIVVPSDLGGRDVPLENSAEGLESSGEREIRKMKSAGDLRRGKSANLVNANDEMPRPALSHYPTSISSSNLLNMTGSGVTPDQTYNRQFASLGPNSQLIPSSRPPVNAARPQLSQSMWDSTGNDSNSNNSSNRTSFTSATHTSSQKLTKSDLNDSRQRPAREKSGRWGFLKKMSMGRIKPDAPSSSPSGLPSSDRSGRSHKYGDQSGSISRRTFDRTSKSPQIDVRLSTTGKLDALPILSSLEPVLPQLKEPPQAPIGTSSSSSLVPPPSFHLRSKRRSFLPVEAPGIMSLSIPENSTFVSGIMLSQEAETSENRLVIPSPMLDHEQYIRREEDRARDAYTRALRSVMAYLKDMNDLGAAQQGNPLSMYGSSDDYPTLRSRRPTIAETSRELSMTSSGSTTMVSLPDIPGQLRSSESIAGLRSESSSQTLSVVTTDSSGSLEERKFKDDKGKRVKVIQEILKTERTYVAGLQELVDIYIKPSAVPVNLLSGVGSSKDTVVPSSERKIVFGGVDALFSFHKNSFLPALEGAAAPLMDPSVGPEADLEGQLSIDVAKAVGNIFVKHAAFMKMYSSYINNFDSSIQRISYWSSDRSMPSPSPAISPSSSTAQLVGLGITMAITNPNLITDSAAATGIPNLTTGQRKRIKAFLKRCRINPRHTQLNLEGYLLLPVQRIPRYKLMLEELLRSTPPTEYMDDPLDRALMEIALLANNMNEGKRESESRRKLVQWQSRIRGKFPSPLVQPHRRLIMDGPLLLTRVVRKAVVSFEAINGLGDASTVQVDCLAPELTPRPLIGILCNDLLVLCRDPSEGQDLACNVDLWAVLRMQTLPQPASIVHGNALRLVDNKAILYFDAPSPSDALNWYRAINLHIPASKA